MSKLVQLAHGIVEDGGNNSAMAVPRGSGVALAKAEMRNEVITLAIKRELQVHAIRIVFAAGEAQVLLSGMRFSAVTGYIALSGHKA